MIHSLDAVDSTHLWLIEKLKSKRLAPPVAVTADRQLAGIGSRGNAWTGMEGNLFLSFGMHRSALVADLPQQSMSIYFSWLLKATLAEAGSKVWLKWPNDFYVGEKKAGGTITALVRGDIVVCSIGLNLQKAPEGFATIDIDIDKNALLASYFLKLKQDILWKDIFREYKVEFLQSTRYRYYDKTTQKKVLLKDAVLQDDGSILIENRRVYSLR